MALPPAALWVAYHAAVAGMAAKSTMAASAQTHSILRRVRFFLSGMGFTSLPKHWLLIEQLHRCRE